VLVDDASTDDAVAQITRWSAANSIAAAVIGVDETPEPGRERPWLTVVASRVNAGFVDTCNIGLRYIAERTDAPYVLLLNNDAAVSPTYFAELASAVAARPDAGLFSGTIYEWDRSTVWYAGARFNPLRALATHDLVLPDSGDPQSTGYICGCTMLISRQVLEKVGLLAECFRPCYVEDVDYSLRVHAAGFPVLYAPRAICYHRVGTSLGRASQSPRTVFSVNRNRAFTLRRNYRGWRRAVGVMYLGVTKPGRALLELAKGRPRIAMSVVSGMLTGLLSPAARQD
jgi:GT2 family glycosyltransferase